MAKQVHHIICLSVENNGWGMQEIKLSEVQKHNKEDDAWVVIHGNVVDVTDFLPQHPGGKAILQQYAGKVRHLPCHLLAASYFMLMCVDL
jgi:hypothetical protein